MLISGKQAFVEGSEILVSQKRLRGRLGSKELRVP